MKGRTRLFLAIMCACCLLGGCGDKSTPVKDGGSDKSSVSSSAEKKEKDDATQTESADGQKDERQNEDGFASDWQEGHENHYGYGELADWNRSERLRNYVVQDGWLYYSGLEKIYKMPINGKSDEVQVVLNLRNYYNYGYRETINIEVAKDWIYFLDESENGGLYRIRTDGDLKEQVLSANQMVISGDSAFYVVDDKVYYIAKEMKGASASSADYYFASYDLNTKEIVSIMQLDETCRLQACFEDSVVIYGLHVRVDLEGNVLTEFDPNVENDEMKKFVLWDLENGNPVFLNYTYRGSHIVEFPFEEDNLKGKARIESFYLLKYRQDGTVESTDVLNFGNVYVDVVNDDVICEGHFLEIPGSENAIQWNGIYYGKHDGEYVKVNSDFANQIFGIDDYIYYNVGVESFGAERVSYDETMNQIPVKYRVKRDGTGFEDISWMFP